MSINTLHERLPASARVVTYRGAPAPAVYSDAGSEFVSFRSGCGVFESSWRSKVILTGSDRVRWLNGMITNNVRDLASNRAVYAFLLNPQGRILGDLYAYNRSEYLLVDTDRFQLEKVLATFDHYIIMDDVEVTDSSDKLATIGLAGPNSRAVMARAGIEVPDLEILQVVDLTWQQVGLSCVRGDNSAVELYELWLAPTKIDLVWNALLAAGAAPVGVESLELLRVASGVPLVGADIRERDLPQETRQDRALNFSKGCYIGQEIVERIRSRGSVHRKFTGFAIEGALPAPGTTIQADGKDVGEITSVATLPASDGDYLAALGYVRQEAGTPGTRLDAGSSKAIITDIPFAEVFKN